MHMLSPTDEASFIRSFTLLREHDGKIKDACCHPDELRHRLREAEDAFVRTSFYLLHAVPSDGRTRIVGGYAIIGRRLVAVHSTVRGLGDFILRHAELDGATVLDTFADSAMHRLVTKWGWCTRTSWPNHVEGGPDVVECYLPVDLE